MSETPTPIPDSGTDGRIAFTDSLRQGLAIARLRAPAIDRALTGDGAAPHAMLVAAIGGACTSLACWRPVLLPLTAAGAVTLLLLFSTMVWVAATRLYGGHGSVRRIAVPLGLAGIIFWATAAPMFGILVLGLGLLWQLVVAVPITERACRITREQAIMAVLLAAIAAWLLLTIVGLATILVLAIWTTV